MLYLPRLYVYHCDTRPGSAESERFKVMERRLLKQIINPAMIATWLFGIVLVLTPGIIDWSWGWWHVKLPACCCCRASMARCRAGAATSCTTATAGPQRFYRAMNEIPTVLMVIIVIMVIVRPF